MPCQGWARSQCKSHGRNEKFALHAAFLSIGRLGSRDFQKEVRDTGWLSVMRVRIVWISSIDKASVGDKKSFHLTDRFCDHALRLAGQKLLLLGGSCRPLPPASPRT